MTQNDLLTFDGTTQPVTEWALDYGIPAARILERLSRGWSVDRAITQPMKVIKGKVLPDEDLDGVNPRAHLYTHEGQTLTIAEWAQRAGISASTLTRRLRHGVPIAEALTPANRDLPYTHDGKTMTLAEWAEHTGLGYSTLRYRVIRMGLPFADAIAMPLHAKPNKAGEIESLTKAKNTTSITFTLGDVRIEIKTTDDRGVSVNFGGVEGTGAGSFPQEIANLEFSN
jgi:hypothetical protein